MLHEQFYNIFSSNFCSLVILTVIILSLSGRMNYSMHVNV